jgi:hypothetical protein
MADSQLSVQVVVDASQINGVLEPATSAAKDAFSDLAAAQIRVKSASYELNSTLNTLAKSGLAPTAEQTEEVAAAMFEAEQASRAMAAAEAALHGETEKVAASANNARAAFMGLNRELGLGGNRALSTFISQSQTLGPILSAAFTGIAIAGFIQLAVTAGEKLSALIDDTFIFTAAQKALYAQELGANQAIAQANEQHSQMLRQIAAIGLPATEQAKLRAQYAREDAEGLAATIAQQEKAVALAQQQLALTQQKLGAKPINYAAPVSPDTAKLLEQLDKQRQTVDSLNAQLGVLRAQYKAAGDAVAAAQKQMATDAAKQQTEDLKNYNRELEREGKAAEEAAVKRGEAERQALNEKEKIDEEMDRATQESAKRDLETFRHSLAEKNRLVAEEGKTELAQIRANAELTEKATAEHKGAASPEIKAEAFEAYKEEIGVIQQLITAENQLQAALKATGAAVNDPKILESMRRQDALLQQESASWDRYATKVQQVLRAQQQQVSQMVNAIGADFSRGIVSWMNGQETFGRAMQKVWTQFADTVVSSLLKAGFQMIANAAQQNALLDSTKMHQAASAARSTWAAVSAIPIIGPFLAPEAAAAAFAGVMAFESGGMVPGYGPTPAIVHGGEMILNADQQRALGAGGGDTFHYHQHIAGNATSETLRGGQVHFEKSLKRTLRRLNR